MMHHWSGPHGVPGGPQRWQHGTYRWRQLLEAVVLVALALVLTPPVVALAEVAVGGGLMSLGVVMGTSALDWDASLSITQGRARARGISSAVFGAGPRVITTSQSNGSLAPPARAKEAQVIVSGGSTTRVS